jgi:hypothetical protein
MTIKYTKNFPFQGPPKYTQIGIFGLKINHLATLLTTVQGFEWWQTHTYVVAHIHWSNTLASLNLSATVVTNKAIDGNPLWGENRPFPTNRRTRKNTATPTLHEKYPEAPRLGPTKARSHSLSLSKRIYKSGALPVSHCAPRNMASMLWSQFSAISPIFGRKNWRFPQKPMLWSGWPDWTNFCLLGHCLQWADYCKLQKVVHISGYFFTTGKDMH